MTVLALPAVLAAQAAPSLSESDSTGQPSVASTSSRCLDTLSANGMHRVVVYLVPHVPDTAARAVLPQADLIAQTVAQEMRALLGVATDSLPKGEPTLTWRTFAGTLALTAHRSGHLTWRSGQKSAADTPGEALLARAAAAAFPDSAGVMSPDSLAADSAVVVLRLVSPRVDREGRVSLPQMRAGFPVFSILEPWREPVRPAKEFSAEYPSENDRAGMEGTLFLQFVVDTTGRAEAETVRDRWVSSRPRPTGTLGHYYDQFVDAAKRAVARSRFEPARVGGCAVPQMVMQPFVFKQRR